MHTHLFTTALCGLVTRQVKVVFAPLLLATVVLSGITGCRGAPDKAAVGITGHHHMDSRYNISDIYLDGYAGANVGREGGGGTDLCCFMIPKTWKPQLSVDLRWAVADWSNEKLEETDRGIYKSIKFTAYRAQVPVEKYDQPGQLHIHFYPGGKARIVVGEGPWSPLLEDPRAGSHATAGKEVPELFTQAEREELDRRWEKGRSTLFGDWR